MSQHTVTLIAGPLGDMQPGRPFDGWEQVPADARAWAAAQARSEDENEVVTIIDGDHRADLGADYQVYVTSLG